MVVSRPWAINNIYLYHSTTQFLLTFNSVMAATIRLDSEIVVIDDCCWMVNCCVGLVLSIYGNGVVFVVQPDQDHLTL